MAPSVDGWAAGGRGGGARPRAGAGGPSSTRRRGPPVRTRPVRQVLRPPSTSFRVRCCHGCPPGVRPVRRRPGSRRQRAPLPPLRGLRPRRARRVRRAPKRSSRARDRRNRRVARRSVTSSAPGAPGPRVARRPPSFPHPSPAFPPTRSRPSASLPSPNPAPRQDKDFRPSTCRFLARFAGTAGQSLSPPGGLGEMVLPMAARLKCDRCGAGLVPAVHGLRCPRFGACGREGPDESAERAWSRRMDDDTPGLDVAQEPAQA